jgi:hypothetical protein
MLLCAHGLFPANQAEPGLLNLTSTSFAHYPALQVRVAMPRIRTGRHCSARFRPKLIC